MLLINGNVFTPTGFVQKDILIEDTKIKYIGNINDPMDNVIDVKGCYIVPGFTDISTSVGLIEAGVKTEGNDLDEKSMPCISDLHAIDGVNFEDRYFKEAIKNGITSVVVSSGNLSVIGARSSLIKTNAIDYSSIIRKDVDISITLGEKPKKEYGSGFYPISRMGIADVVRKTLTEAKQYMLNENMDYNSYNPMLEALVPILKRELPLKIYAEKSQDILTAINIKKEFNIDIIINGGAESYKLIDEIKANDIPVILGSGLLENSFIELIDRKENTANVLNANNILIALSTRHPTINIDLLQTSMCLMCKYGLDEIDAINAVTLSPIKMLGLDKQLGSIEEGKIANIAIFNDNPTYSLSSVIYTIIDGEVVYKK